MQGGCLAGAFTKAGLDWVLGCAGAVSPDTDGTLVSDFGNGHTRISNLASVLAAKGSEQQREPSGGGRPLSVVKGYECRFGNS